MSRISPYIFNDMKDTLDKMTPEQIEEIEVELWETSQQAIWEEIEAETGMTRDDYDKEIIDKLKQFKKESEN